MGKSFEMKIVIYRNYNSIPEKQIEATEFEMDLSKLEPFMKKIEAQDGWSN